MGLKKKWLPGLVGIVLCVALITTGCGGKYEDVLVQNNNLQTVFEETGEVAVGLPEVEDTEDHAEAGNVEELEGVEETINVEEAKGETEIGNVEDAGTVKDGKDEVDTGNGEAVESVTGAGNVEDAKSVTGAGNPEADSEETGTHRPTEQPQQEVAVTPSVVPASTEPPKTTTVPQETTAADTHVHTFEKYIWELPTCQKGGYYNNICTICGEVECVTQEALPHDTEDIVVQEGNCMEDTIIEHICKNCGVKVKSDTRYTVYDKHMWITETIDDVPVEYCEWCGVAKP